jgi:hypothetical protein
MLNRRIPAMLFALEGLAIFALLGFGQVMERKSQQTPTPDFVASQFAAAAPSAPQSCPAATAIYRKVNDIEKTDPDEAAEYLTELIERYPEEYEALWLRAIILENSGHKYGALVDLKQLLAHVEANPNRNWGFGITYERVEQALHQVKANLGK